MTKEELIEKLDELREIERCDYLSHSILDSGVFGIPDEKVLKGGQHVCSANTIDVLGFVCQLEELADALREHIDWDSLNEDDGWMRYANVSY